VDTARNSGDLAEPKLSRESRGTPSGVPFSARLAPGAVTSFAFVTVNHVTILN
jgi:hypothetical protein